MPKVVIVMPAYRAARTLAKTVQAIPAGVADELLLVDDASPDGTADLARRMGLRVHVHPTNLGYGGNQKTCYTQALRDGADIVVLLHPDYQYDPEAVPLLVAPLLAGRADMTFGSRFAGLGDPIGGGMPLYRYVGNRMTTALENLMLGSRFTEMHSGMRAYSRDCLLSLPFLTYSNGFSFDSQFMVDAVTSGLRVVEVPIPTRYTEESSSIGIGRSLRYVATSLAYCAWRTAERGRRGRRSPVVLRRSATAGLVSGWLSGALGRLAVDEGDVGVGGATSGLHPVLGESRGFFVRGTRVASAPVNGSSGPGSADVMVIRTHDVDRSDPAGYLSRVRRAMDDEGVLIAELDANGDGATFGDLLRAMPEAGFAPIAWSRSSPETIVARPVSRRTSR
ncbi:MAG: glycosyltransferase family 2 protein [Actinomycetota bacterium]